MKRGDIVSIKVKTFACHARLCRPLLDGWVVELVCNRGVQEFKDVGHFAHIGYRVWIVSKDISMKKGHIDQALSLCGDECIAEFDEEVELYKTYGGE